MVGRRTQFRARWAGWCSLFRKAETRLSGVEVKENTAHQHVLPVSGNVYLDLGYSPDEAARRLRDTDLAIAQALADRKRRIDGIIPLLAGASDEDLVRIERALGLLPRQRLQKLPGLVRWPTWAIAMLFMNILYWNLGEGDPAVRHIHFYFLLPVAILGCASLWALERYKRKRGTIRNEDQRKGPRE